MQKVRNSTIELLRIVCMLMILIQHADFWLFGYPAAFTLRALGACVIESVSIIAVNVFVLISGYFGIRFKGIKIVNLLFQCLWAVIPVTLLFMLVKGGPIAPLSDWYRLFFPFGYWYVTAYIGLIVLAPVLDAFIEQAEKKRLAMTIFLLSLSAFIFDMVIREEAGLAFAGGYSTLWMVNLYLMGRYLRLYPLRNFGAGRALAVFLGYVTVQSVLFFFHLTGTRYTNPLLVIGSVAFFWMFTHFNFSSKVINRVASSALMVYLFSMHPLVIQLYGGWLHRLNATQPLPLFLTGTCTVIVIIFLTAILYDKIRMVFWRGIEPWCQRMVDGVYRAFDRLCGFLKI